MQLIGLSGKSRSGKDLFYELYGKPRGWTKRSFAAYLKYKVSLDFGLTPDEVDGVRKDIITSKLNFSSPRQLLIEYGNLFRKFKPNYWCDHAFRVIDLLKDTNSKCMFTDVRYPNEAQYIKERGGLLIRLERNKNRDGLVSEETKQSISETALDYYNNWDLVLQAEDNQIPEDLVFFGDRVDRLLLEKSK